MRAKAFTLIELIVVLAIIALLAAVAVPRYFNSVQRAKEAALKQNLNVMRDAIDKYYGDYGSYPKALDDLVARRYLRKLPEDPLTESNATWVVVAPPVTNVLPQGADLARAAPVIDATRSGVYDVKSAAPGNSLDGVPFVDW